MEAKIAIVIGASGLTGSELVKLLIKDHRYSEIKIFGRNSINFEDKKIIEHIVDMHQAHKYEQLLTGDELFCCIGTTKKDAGNTADYRKIDIDIPATFANICCKNNVESCYVVSAIGVKKGATNNYLKIKYDMETQILNVPFKNIGIFRPSLIIGERKKPRLLESITKIILNVVSPLLVGKMKRYRGNTAQAIANSMIYTANTKKGIHYIEAEEISKPT